MAYYPTEVPFHHRSRWLDERDPFGELVAGCRKLGMVLLARTDPHATYDDVRGAHPDWIAVDAQGQPCRRWASPELPWDHPPPGDPNRDHDEPVTVSELSKIRRAGANISLGTRVCLIYNSMVSDRPKDLRARQR